MSTGQHDTDRERLNRLQRRNGFIAASVIVVIAGMAGLSYAAVPLYRIFCQVTGFEGTTQRVDTASNVVLDKTVRIRFVSYVSSDLEWEFAPAQKTAEIKIGENKLAYYTARNISNTALTGTARYKVMPEIAGGYFNKIECFCFTEQKLEPGQSVKMPVRFFVDPEMVKDASAKGIEEITLSYTFFPVNQRVTGSDTGGKSKTGEKSADL